MTTDERLEEVFVSVFGPEIRLTSDDLGPGDIEGWDSLNHVNLIIAIESEFGVEFATAVIPTLITVGAIRAHLPAS